MNFDKLNREVDEKLDTADVVWPKYLHHTKQIDKEYTQISENRTRKHYHDIIHPSLVERIKKGFIRLITKIIKPSNLKRNYSLGSGSYYFVYKIQGSNPTLRESKKKVFREGKFMKACYEAWVYKIFKYVKVI